MPTSGTTGGPLPVFYSKEFADYFYSLGLYRVRRLQALGAMTRTAVILFALPGNDPDPPDAEPRPRRRTVLGLFSPVAGRISDYFNKILYMGYSIEEVLPQIVGHRPDLLWGSPTYIRMLADAVVARGVTGIHPRAISLGGEPLDEPSRRYFEKVFGCRVYSCYGANEVGLIAAECTAASGLHVNADSLIVEVLKDGQPASPGEQGEIVVTGLLNGAMPIIRYRLGDLGVLSDEICSCGRTLPLLRSVEGRTVD